MPTKVGDVVVGDARVLHAANKNNSDNKRSLITLWYHPHYNKMTDEMIDAHGSYLPNYN